MFQINPLYLTDGYKTAHKAMLAPGTTKLYGTWIPRSTKHAPKGCDKIVSFGHQFTWRYINDIFVENFFSKSWDEVKEFVDDMTMYLGLDYDGSHFKELHDLGYLPIEVKALEEGIQTNPNIPHMTFVNTVDGFAWLTLYLETFVSSLAWKPSTCATIALQYRKNAEKWINATDKGSIGLVPFMCHNFSARGLNPHDMISVGLGHDTSFRGDDTLAVIPAARYFYDETGVCVNSVNASEHSVSTTKIFTVGEQQMIEDWLKIFPTGILSVVSDTFDLWKLITRYLPNLKDQIMARDGKLVCRPDSGSPVDIICGEGSKYADISKYFPEGEVLPKYFEDYLLDEVIDAKPHGEQGVYKYENTYLVRGKLYKAKIHNIQWNRYDKQYYFIDMYDTAEITVEEIEWQPRDKGVVELLWDIFGGTVNEQGFKVLDPHIGVIYGDSITLERQVQMYERLAAKGFAASNILLGVGSFTYQYNTRDTFGFAAKGAWFELDQGGVKKEYAIYKDPITDDGTKKSLKGLQMVYIDEFGEYQVVGECTKEVADTGELKVIFKDGKFYNQTTLTQVRERINKLVGKQA